MNKGKEKEGTNASTFDDHLNIGLRRTPEEANPEEHQTVGSICCPNCSHKFEPTPEMLVEFFEQFMGKIGGVKFEPSDQQLIDHLEAKVNRSGDHKPNPLMDEFIATIEGDEGICYTHPDRLPGVTIDGTSKHFFHKSSKAYKTGTRKRRRIHSNKHYEFSETRWHKTGKTRPVISDNGIQKGCKKILVLYTDFGKSKRPTKTNWIMHQYHLGGIHDEKEGGLVLSKIFYQTHPRQPSEDRKYASGNEYSESANINNSEVLPLEHKVQPEAHEQIGYMPMAHHLNIEELQPQTTAMPAFHLDTSKPPPQVLPMQAFRLNAPNRPFTPVAMAADHPMHEASAILANKYQQSMLPSSNYQLEQQQQVHGNTTFSLEEIITTGCTSADPKEGTSNANANSNSNAEWPGFFNWQTNNTQDPPGPHN